MPKKKATIVVDVNKMRTGAIDADGRMRLAFTAIDTYLTCGQRFKFRYKDDIKAIPGIALLEGSSHHKALEHNNLAKIKSGLDLSHDALTDIFMDDFRKRVQEDEKTTGLEWGEETEDNIFKRAKVLHERYIRDIAPALNPVLAERKMEKIVDLDKELQLLLVCVIDIEEQKRFYDYKTAAKAKSQSEVDNSLQLTLYSWATGKNQCGIIQLLKKANPEVGIVISDRTGMQKRWALKVAISVAKAIKADVFPLALPTSWACSERFCGYWGRCRGKS